MSGHRTNWFGCMALLLTLGLAACAAPPPAPPPAIPPPQAESPPLPPLSAEVQVWRPGHWNWDGRGYVWIPGEYQTQGTHSAMFQLGYWRQNPMGWIWEPARWL